MDRLYREVIQKLKSKITDDVHVDYGVIDHLKRDDILSREHITFINKHTSRVDKIEKLLEILLKQGPNSLKSFHESLKKNYDWLYEAIKNELRKNKKTSIDMTIYDTPDSLRSSNMPMPPELNVDRKKKTEELTNALKELLPEKYVVLHGMKGYGKSCLASMTLRNSQNIQRYFEDVWWMNFGCKEPLDDLISTRLYNLYHKIISSSCPYSIVHSQGPITRIKNDDIRRELRKHFENCETHMNSLLVLDDVSDKKIIETFDFHCKILVLTTDIEVLDINNNDESTENRQKVIIKMHDGFTEEESLQLFANALNTNKEDLPAEAKLLHQECGGMPILIAIFAAQFQEFADDMKKNRNRWQYYLEAIRNKDVSTKIVEKSIAKQTAIFDMCIKQLSEEEKSKYFQLAIFNEDVNITPKTLSILWKEKTHKVDEFMVNLRKKSLVFKWWNDELDTYIYGIHELLLCHLRKLNKHKLVEMHEHFVSQYFERCNGDLSKLPTDNYSYSYIGHHLEEAQMYNKFKAVYLDFKFIQSKICNSGVNDLLFDLKKYRTYIKMSENITQEEEIEKKIVDLENFLKRHAKTVAEYRNRGCLDLIQMALSSNTNQGFVYETAKNLANLRAKEYLYLWNNYKPLDSFRLPLDQHGQYLETVSIEVSTIHSTDDPDKIIIGGKSGKLTRWDCSETKKHISFNGFDNKSTIIKVIVSHKGKFFIALNNQSIIKLFNLSDIEEVEDACKKIHPLKTSSIPPTPIEKQIFWSKRNNGELEDMSLETFTMDDNLDICDIALSFDDRKIAVCSTTGVMKVWEIHNEKKMVKVTELKIEYQTEIKFQQQLLAFSKLGDRIGRVNEDGLIYIFVWQKDIYKYKTYINALYEVPDPGRKLVYFKELKNTETHTDNEKILDNMNYILVTSTSVIQCNFASNFGSPRTIILTKTNNSTKFIAATLTNDEQYLITADNEDLIKIWKINDRTSTPEKIYKDRATVLDTYDDDHYIITWGNKNYIQKMFFQPHVPNTPHIITSIFDAVMYPIVDDNSEQKEDIVIQDINRIKTKLSSVSETMIDAHGTLDRLILNSTGKTIFYSTDNKKLYRYNIMNYEKEPILILPLDKDFVRFIEYEDQFSNVHLIIIWEANTPDNSKKTLGIMNGSTKVVYGYIEDVGKVIAVQKMNNKYAIVVTEDEKFFIWKVTNYLNLTTSTKRGIPCERIVRFSNPQSKIVSSSSNVDGSMLAVLTDTNFHLYTIQFDIEKDNSTEGYTKIEPYFKGFVPEKTLSSSSFSPDNKYLALGTLEGEVLLINIMTNECFTQGTCTLHKSSILQLHWAPRCIDVPILLTINCDELAWWKVDLIINKINEKKRRSRTGLTRSATIPLPNSSGDLKSLSLNVLPNFQSIDTPDTIRDLSLANNSNNHDSIDKAHEFWSSKKVIHDNKWPGLLGLIQLHPHERRAKICVSSDFRKFLFVDTNGSINKLMLFQL